MKLKQMYEKMKPYLVDSTAAITLINPPAVLYENAIIGMSDKVSLNARLFAAAVYYSGVVRGLAKLRDYSKKKFNITDKSSEKMHLLHDIIYVTGVSIPLATLRYTVAGASPKQILYGVGMSMAVSAVMGGPTGYAFDIFRDLTGVKSSERVPEKIRNLSPNVKKGLAALLVAGSIATCATIYSLTPPKQTTHNIPQLEEIVKNK